MHIRVPRSFALLIALAIVVPNEAGGTAMSEDQRNLMACLYDGAHSLTWQQVTTSPAAAAPAARPAVAAEPTDAQQHRWQGWYAGVSGGYTEGTNDYASDANFGGVSPDVQIHPNAFGAPGAQGGYNFVSPGGFLYGAEVDANYLGIAQHMFVNGSDVADAKSVWNDYESARGRAGVAFDQGLLFLTGGLALANVRDQVIYIPIPNTYSVDKSETHLGWTAGAGTEISLTHNISLGLEYLHIQFFPVDGVSGGNVEYWHITDSLDVFRLAANWHFD